MSSHNPELYAGNEYSNETGETATTSERYIRTVRVPFSDEFQFALDHNMLPNLKTRPLGKDASAGVEILFNGRDLTRHNCWEEVRLGRGQSNELFPSTGWNGYVADLTPEERSSRLIAIGKDMLRMLKQEFPFDPAMRTRYINALIKEEYHAGAMQFWNGVFGAEIAVNRSKVSQSPKLQAFRKETEQIVAGLPTPKVISNGTELIHQYGILKKPSLTLGTIPLTEEDALALKLLKKSGILGSPITRALIESRV